MTGGLGLPGRLWSRCASCTASLYRRRLGGNLEVCPECGVPGRLTAPERIRQVVDPGRFTPLAQVPAVGDPLGFVDVLPYPQRLAAARAATGLPEAVLCGTAVVGGHRAALAVMDFRFLGGSVGCAAGGLITRTAERALADRTPLILFTASGGARMQEGALSLMQLAAVSQAVAVLREQGLLTISVITDPTYGGVAASFATNTDVVVAESGARMGFAGPRVIRRVSGRELPAGFGTAEFLLARGQVDLVAERRLLRGRLVALLAAGWAGHRRAGRGVASGPVAVRQRRRRAPAAAPQVAGRQDARGSDAWSTVRLARDPGRPTTLDYLASVFEGFVELHGDRVGADCPAIVGGLARLDGVQVMVVGHQKGHDRAELAARNFARASPAGHRKALRLMRLAARLGLPVVTLVDTPGADCGVGAEEQGQAGSIAESILGMSVLPVPVLAVVTGEGGSGGALALAVADRVLMLQHAVYSVVSPEGCAAVLWPDRPAAPEAARALRLTAPDLLGLGVVDEVVAEPPGGAQRDREAAAGLLRRALVANLAPLREVSPGLLVARRRQRFRRYGEWGVLLDPPAGVR